ncbi:unnamed protein product [Blepharisma stoltei]|uniref:Transmembrane protein n=1 Tax=Blepharisma stoltei TaxID=1481888 RepID=A0AAU9JUK7_9CILI|nr:unnamed protein product [Blepharisma stoltei]
MHQLRDQVNMEVNPIIVRSILLAFIIGIACFATLYLTYLLLLDYLEVVFLSIFFSISIRPIKDNILIYFLRHKTEKPYFSMVKESLLFHLFYLVKSTKNISAKSVTSIGQTTLIVFLSAAYLIVFKLRFKLFWSISIIIVLLDFTLRLLYDIYNIIRHKTWIEIPSGLFITFVTIGTIIGVIMVLIILHTLAIGYTVLEFKDQGKALIDQFSATLSSKQAQDLVDKVYDVAKQSNLIELTKFEFIDFSNKDYQACSAYIDDLDSIPFIGKLLSPYVKTIDFWLDYANLSSYQILNFYYIYSDLIHEFLLDATVLTGNTLFTSVSLVTSSITSTLSTVILFFTLVILLMNDKKSLLERIFAALPMNASMEYPLITSINMTVIGLFKSLWLCAAQHYAITWILYDFLDIEMKYTVSAITAFVALFPVLYSWYFNIPTIIWLCFNMNFGKAIAVFVVEFSLDILDAHIYAENMKGANPNIVALAMFLGIYQFGLLGILYGPLIASAVIIILNHGSIPK